MNTLNKINAYLTEGGEHVGKLMDIITVDVTLIERRPINSKGPYFRRSGEIMYKFKGNDGNNYVAFDGGIYAIRLLLRDDKIGKKVRITGQIRKHSTFKNQKENTLRLISAIPI